MSSLSEATLIVLRPEEPAALEALPRSRKRRDRRLLSGADRRASPSDPSPALARHSWTTGGVRAIGLPAAKKIASSGRSQPVRRPPTRSRARRTAERSGRVIYCVGRPNYPAISRRKAGAATFARGMFGSRLRKSQLIDALLR